MMEKDSNNWYLMGDTALLTSIGQFIQDTRLQQNKTQLQVAAAAGVSRTTLSQIEKGSGGTLITLIQILRALEQLSVLKVFEIEKKASPLLLARLELKKRRRARNNDGQNEKPGFKSSW